MLTSRKGIIFLILNLRYKKGIEMKISKFIIAAAATIISTSAFAAYSPSHYVERVYYQSANNSSIVGESTRFCSGSFYSTGTTTAYYSELKISCNNNF